MLPERNQIATIKIDIPQYNMRKSTKNNTLS